MNEHALQDAIAATPNVPRKSAEEVLEALDENGRERTEVERLIHRMMRDQPWLIWSGRPWYVGGRMTRGGWGPDASGFPGRSEPRAHADWDAAGRRGRNT